MITVDIITMFGVTFNQSQRGSFWRLIHDGVTVMHLFDSEGITCTINHLYCGTEQECLAEIDRLNLLPKIGYDENL